MAEATDVAPCALIAAIALATTIAMAWAGLAFDNASAVPPLVACVVLLALTVYYRCARLDTRLATSLMCSAQLIAFTACAAPLSYAVASANWPLWDDALASWDRALGLDWRSYLAFVNGHPCLGSVFSLAYQSLMPQLIVAIAALGFTGRLNDCRAFVLAVMIAGLTAIMISAFMPAMAMFVHLGLHPQDYDNLRPAAAFVHVADMIGLRSGTLKLVSLKSAEGIITFPSFHAALGVILSWAFWQVPRVRWPGLALNIVLIAATPIDGGHYFVDVIAGALVAGVAIRAARALDRCGSREVAKLSVTLRKHRETGAYSPTI